MITVMINAIVSAALLYAIYIMGKDHRKFLYLLDEMEKLTDTISDLEDKIGDLEMKIDNIDEDILDGTFSTDSFNEDLRQQMSEEVERAVENEVTNIKNDVEELDSKVSRIVAFIRAAPTDLLFPYTGERMPPIY